ncbi:MAG: TolC family protein [Lachnospiraceae bacterium]|nr:TolC family protein [Lachnospiraceae bacterium]MBQ9608683.1 TolC family protein [Lachnospiraceae bacterium]
MLSLRTNYSLMSTYYGSKVNTISGYITKVINGGNLDKRAFKKDYDAFLKNIDKPWTGYYKVWFIKFPKEWLKGSLDGIRYIEDDPYVLYQDAIDYESARKEKENTRLDLIATVDDGYENYAESRKAYLTAVDELQKAEEAMILGDVQFLLGQITEDEYTDLENALNSAITGEAEALAAYSETTYTFDRDTCGGVSAFFASQNVDMTADERSSGLGSSAGGKTADDVLQTLVPVYETGATYSIDYLADELMFELRIDIPSGFSVTNVNYYELWCDGIQVGPRTGITSSLKQMVLATSDIETCEIYFYSEASGTSSYITKSSIDPSVTRGNLEFIKDYNTFTAEGMVIGSYDVKNSTKTGTLEIDIKLNDSYGVGRFAVKAGNVYKQKADDLSDEQTGTLYLKESTVGQYSNISDTYSYLDAVSGDLEELTIEFTDEEGNKLFEAIFETSDQSIVVPRDQLDYINNYQSSN